MPKWAAIGQVADKSLADVDPDTIESIYDETQGLPKPGPYRMNLKRLQGVTSKVKDDGSGGDPMLKMVLEIAEPPGTKKAKFNGYSVWHYQLSTKERAGGVNALLKAILDGKSAAQLKKVLDAYWAGNVIVDDQGMITKIGAFMVPDSVLIGANLVPDKSGGDYGERMRVGFNGIMPASQAPKPVAGSDDDADADDDDDLEDEATEDEEGDEDEEARAEELDGMSLADLRKLAKELGVTGKGKPGLIEAILDAEFTEDEDADEEDEDDEEVDEEEDEEEPEGDDYDEMDRAALRKEAKELGVRVTTKMSDDAIRTALRAAAEDADEDEEDEEDEPEPTPARKGRAKATAAAPGRSAARRRKGSASDEPPF